MLKMYGSDDYLETQVRTASPEKLHLMVVEAAIKFGRQGLDGLTEKDYEKSFNAFSRSRACVAELIAGIKPEPNAELAEKLRSLFTFVHKQLAVADLNHDSKPAQDALTVLEMHRETWRELLQRLQTERAPMASAAASPTKAVPASPAASTPPSSWVT